MAYSCKYNKTDVHVCVYFLQVAIANPQAAAVILRSSAQQERPPEDRQGIAATKPQREHIADSH